MKRILLLAAALFAAVASFGQTVLPNDPAVKVGKLDNGMTYYIRHNDKPAQRCEFYLGTNVGAYQEADDQDGLAHFLEHMCFNGTKNFPGKALLDYLQSIGAEFGRNINASTGFESTQYMLNNIPIVRESIIDSCLLVMHDYSHFVTCDQDEIDAERGVILEERRTRRDANWRMFEQSLPYLFGDTKYARRTLIGSEEQLKTFKRESLVNFYHTWYRPDMQALVVVGDIDVNQIEAKIKDIFSDIPAPEVPTEKPWIKIPDNQEPIVGILTDKEATRSSISIMWKGEPMPKEIKNTDQAYLIDLVKTYIYFIMNERFTDIAAKPDAPFFNASFSFSQLCNECETADGSVSFKDGEAIRAFNALMTEIEKMKRYGFNESEFQRAKDIIISLYEKDVEAASSRKNPDFIQPILHNFFKNEPFMEPQTELQLVKMISSQLNAQILSQIVKEVITDENIVIIYNGPEKEGLVNPTKEELVNILNSVKTAEIEANVEESTNEPLLDPATLKGSAVKKTTKTIHDATEWTLKNGLKVVVLPTDYKADQVIFDLSIKGGKSLIADEDLPSFEENVWALFLNNSGLGKFPNTTLSKMLASKHASAEAYISSNKHGVSGWASPKDLETAFQILYMKFAEPRFDENEFKTGMQQIEAVLPNLINTPGFAFQQTLNETLFGGSKRVVNLNEETLAKANLATIERVYRQLFSGVNGAVLTIVGNVELNTLKPLVEKYAGSIAKGKKIKNWNVKNMPNFVKGDVRKEVKMAMETPKNTVLQAHTAYFPIDVKTQVTLDIAKYALDMIYTKTLREEEGGTYGAGVGMSALRTPQHRVVLEVFFDTNPESQAKLRELAIDGLKKLAAEGPTDEQFTSAIGNFKKNLPEQRINNGYWIGELQTWELIGVNHDAEYEAALDTVTKEDVKNVLNKVLEQGNFIEVVLSPAE